MEALHEVVSRILIANGAVVEPIEPDGIEALLPERVQTALSVPELCRLGFSAELPDRALPVTMESDWMERLAGLLEDRGRFLSLCADELPALPSPDPERLLGKTAVFENASFRVGKVCRARTSYLLLTFRVTAVSDEKREDLIYLCVNESSGLVSGDLVEPIHEHLRDLKMRHEAFERATRPDHDRMTHGLAKQSPAASADAATPHPASGLDEEPAPEPWNAEKIKEFVAGTLPGRIRTRFGAFISGMERRMGRDIERIHSYHSDLRDEIVRVMTDKLRRGLDNEELEKRTMRIAAIEREFHAKIADLKRRYAMTADVEALQILRVIMPVHRLPFTVLRRKGTRAMHLDYNPLSRTLDSLSCEHCSTQFTPQLVCDDALHLLCPDCLAACPACNRPYCRACHPVKCPKCNRK